MFHELTQFLWEDESGQDLVEYVLILVLVALVVFVALQTLGTNVSTKFSSAASAVGN